MKTNQLDLLPTPKIDREFGGKTYDAKQDRDRLRTQLKNVLELMRDGDWWTLQRIQNWTGYPQASISARLRDLRKFRFGGHAVNRRRVPNGNGLFEYQLIENRV